MFVTVKCFKLIDQESIDFCCTYCAIASYVANCYAIFHVSECNIEHCTVFVVNQEHKCVGTFGKGYYVKAFEVACISAVTNFVWCMIGIKIIYALLSFIAI